MSKSMVHLKVEFTINEGKLDAFEALAQTMIAGSMKEPGTLGYDFLLEQRSQTMPASRNLRRRRCGTGSRDRAGGEGVCAQVTRSIETDQL